MERNGRSLTGFQLEEWHLASHLIQAARPPARFARIRLASILSNNRDRAVFVTINTYLNALLLDELINEREASKTRQEVANLAALIDSRWRKITGAQSADLVWPLNFSLGYDNTRPGPESSLWELIV